MDAEEGVSTEGGSGAGEQAPDRMSAVAGQFELVGDLAEGHLDAVAQHGDQPAPGTGQVGTLAARGGDEDHGATDGQVGGEGAPAEAPVQQQASRGGSIRQQVTSLRGTHRLPLGRGSRPARDANPSRHRAPA